MKTNVRTFYEIEKELKLNYPKLNEYEVLTLAIQIERNEILENGLGVRTSDDAPSAVEAIAIALGYDSSRSPRTITEVLKDIADKDN